MRRTGLVRGSGRTGRRIASAPENGVVHRAHHIHRRTHHIPSPIAAVPHGIQQHPHHEDTDDQHDHRADGRTVGGGRCGRVGGVPAAVTAAAGRVQPGLCIEHVRLPEEGRHRTVEIAAVIGRLDGLTQLVLLGVGHGIAHVVAAVHLPVAVLHQQQDHVVAAQSPRLAQLGGIVLPVPAGEMVNGGDCRDGVVLSVPAAVIVPDQLLRLVAQQIGIIADPVLIRYVQQLRGLLGDKAVLAALADEHRAHDGDDQHRQRHTTFFEKFHVVSSFGGRCLSEVFLRWRSAAGYGRTESSAPTNDSASR